MLESEELLHTSLDSMLEGYAVYISVREAGRIIDFECTYINAAGAEMFGRPPGDLVGTRIRTLIPQFAAPDRFDDLVRVAETGRINEQVRYGYVDDRVQRVFHYRTWRLDDGLVVTWRDITELKRAMADLRASEERFRVSMQFLNEALSVFTAIRDDSSEIIDFRWSYANEATGSLSLYPQEELVGRRLLDVLPHHGPSGLLDVYRTVVQTGEPWVQPAQWYEDVWGDGQRSRRCFDLRVSRVGDGFVIVARDVTTEQQGVKRFEGASS